ncbi:hypothetical protein ONV75_16590 [Clostridium sp. LQ25]|jgi:hypothetical protein|uniref:hypothetical protein n=1 Tax=Clostridium sp. LQ25 TaxID=2992805 RepID=UPI00224F71FA|nr:hypothetical protein [Clostridium sp. LQ25]UZT06199.1 hypothetical protein ONV75_16590 [Clostridium sp. LQ25]
MKIINQEGKYSEKGLIVDDNLKTNLKGKFTKEEALVLVATYNSVIINETRKNKQIVINSVKDSMDFGEAMFIKVNKENLIEKLEKLNEEEIKALLQIVFECINTNHSLYIDDILKEKFQINQNN